MFTLTVLSMCIVITITAAAPGDRNITITNQCSEVVRVGRTGARCGAADFTNFNDTGCPPGQTLDPTTQSCFWDIPTPEDGKSLDISPGGSISLILSAPEQNCINSKGVSQMLKWSGGIWGATGCSIGQRTCETAICFDGNNTSRNGYCETFSGPVGPVTIAEFTLQNNASDFYDVTVIGGVNLPIEMKPSTGDVLTPSAAEQSGVAADYWCGNPGGITAMNRNLGDCSWTFDPTTITGFGDQSIFLRLIAKSTDPSSPNANCTKDSDCPQADQVCGTLQQLNSISSGPEPNLFPGKCGRLIGLWNADAICTWAAAVDGSSTYPNTAPFKCKSSTDQSGGAFNELYECTAPYETSGYNCNPPNSTNVVCGCPLWENEGINAPATSDCLCNNSVWHQSSLPWVEWMKRACPTSYVFPFDDKSSTFQCKNQVGPENTNGVGYTITFCPSGRNLKLSSVRSDTTNGGISFGSSAAITVVMVLLGTAAVW